MRESARADHREVVDYVLGRMSRSEVEAFEERALATPELSRLIDAARAELVKHGAESSRNQTLEDALLSRLNLLSEANEDVANAAHSHEAPLSDARAQSRARKRRARKFEFIPKFVEIPQRRADSQFVFKRASVMSKEEREKRREAARSVARPARSIFSREKVRYSLVDTFSSLADAQSVCSRLRAEFSASFDAKLRRRFETELQWTETSASIVDHSAISLLAKTPTGVDAFSQRPTLIGAFDFVAGVVADADLAVATRQTSAPAFATHSAHDLGECEYLLAPIEYAQGRTRVAEQTVLYPFEELGEQAEGNVENQVPDAPRPIPVPVPPVPSAPIPDVTVPEPSRVATPRPVASTPPARPQPPRFVTASQETIDAVAAAIGQSAHILPQGASAYFAAEPEDDDRETFGPTLSAEDKRLAELLGRELTAIDLDEYYWEEVDENATLANAKSRGRVVGFFAKFLYAATTPPVLVGRATIALFRVVFPHDVERDEAARETRLRNDKEPVGRFSDMMISTIAGVIIAVCIVFPLLYRVVEELYTVIATSTVRRYSQNVVAPQLETDFDVMPFITEQILHPHYDAGELETAPSGAELENDGLPISN